MEIFEKQVQELMKRGGFSKLEITKFLRTYLEYSLFTLNTENKLWSIYGELSVNENNEIKFEPNKFLKEMFSNDLSLERFEATFTEGMKTDFLEISDQIENDLNSTIRKNNND